MLRHGQFVDSACWDRVRDRLAADGGLILIDGPCHGRGAPTTRRFTVHDCASAATEVLDALAVEDAVDWVGNAWGGHAARSLRPTPLGAAA